MKNKIINAVAAIFALVAILALVGALLGYPVKWLWNAWVPDVLGLPAITFWQAVGMSFLSGLLFKSPTPTK